MIDPKRVVLVAADWPEPERYCSNFNGMRAGLERLNIPYKFVSCRGPKGPAFELDIDAIVAYEPDLIIYTLRDVIQRPDWRREIRARCPNATIVMWYGDYRDEGTWQVKADCSKDIDAMFVSNAAQEQFYKVYWRMPRVEFLPLGCEPIEKPDIDQRFAFDFIFIGGSITGGRFNERAHEIEEYKAKLGLKQINSFENKLRAKIMREMPKIYSSATVSLDVSHFTDVPGYTSNRFWIIPAFWGFALTKRWPGCTDFYPEDSRAYFDTFEEAGEKLRFYLSHEPERVSMLNKAREHVHRHTYDKRFKQMFSML